MNLKKMFSNFYNKALEGETEIGKRNLRNLKERINSLDLKDDLEDDIYTLELNIETIKSNKYGCVNAYNKFLSYLKSKGYKISSSLKKNYETSTRRLELIKFLQTPKTEEEILKEFMISERTLDTDFAEIQKGIEFCGFPLKVKLSVHESDGRRTISDGNKKYCSSCNPIGLALNMTELYLLTKVIPNQLKNKETRDWYEQIISKIYPQLSDNAKELLKIEDDSESNIYEVEYEQLKNKASNQLVYFMKREKMITVIYDDNGKRKEVKGKIRFNYGDNNENTFIIYNGNGETIINYTNLIGIKDFEELYE